MVEDVIVGNGNSVGDHGHCIGRLAVLAAGWPYETPGFTLNRFCGSGQTAVTLAAMGVLSGMQDVVIGGGVESMSRWPVDEGAPPDPRRLQPGAARAVRDRAPGHLRRPDRQRRGLHPPAVRRAGGRQPGAGRQGDRRGPLRPQPRPGPRTPTAASRSTTRSSPGPAPRSTRLASVAAVVRRDGRAPVRRLRRHVRRDVRCGRTRRSTTSTTSTHAGNSSGVVDGASALLVASSDYARAHGLTPRARIITSAVAGAEPVIMLTAPAPASRLALRKARHDRRRHRPVGDQRGVRRRWC